MAPATSLRNDVADVDCVARFDAGAGEGVLEDARVRLRKAVLASGEHELDVRV